MSGHPAGRRIHLSRADVTEVEEEFVLDALRSGWIAPLGPHVEAFEQEMAAYVGVGHAVALSSGTAALHLGLLELGVRPGTVVVLPTLTFAASAHAVLYTGAQPVFVDAGPDGNVDPDLLISSVDTLRAEGSVVSAVMTVDLFGVPADYPSIEPELAARGIPLIEDAAESVGASHHGRQAGAFGAVAALSFNGNKIMTTSGGGMLLTGDPLLAQHARKLATQSREPEAWYEHRELGFNYRMSNILAALGRGQLRRLDGLVRRRRQIQDRYREALCGLPGVELLVDRSPDPHSAGNGWLTCLVIDRSVQVTPTQVIAALASEDIEARHLWKPMHRQPLFGDARSFTTGTADRLFASGVALPSGAELSDLDVSRVCQVLVGALTR